jgi:phosphatidate cytidylyltransferase
MTLTPGSYAYQFTQFCWTHMTLLLVIFQSHFIVNSIFEGLIWFFLPVCLVITNDIFAYICGMIWGRTPLIRLSPKKTVEGFIGGWICTIIIGGGIAYVLTKFKYMICPVTVHLFSFIFRTNCRISEYQHGQVLIVNPIQYSFPANSKSLHRLLPPLANYSRSLIR